jgi:hypothetical protein
MNDPISKDKSTIEARLHRSLTNQISVPKLDGRFDAGVWARIEAEKRATARVAVPDVRNQAAASWLRAVNVAGVLVAAILVAYFGARLLGGVDVSVNVPQVPAQLNTATAQLLGWAITVVVLSVGLMLTPFGRRLRMSLD